MNLITKIFKVFPSENGIVLRFVLLSAMMQAGLTFGITAADSIFLIQVGVDKLPIIYIAAPLLMLIYVPIVTVFLSRFGINHVVKISNLTMLLAGLLLFACFNYFSGSNGPPTWLAYTAKLWAYLCFIGSYSILWNFIDHYFDIQSGKRLYGLFSAGAALGGIVGGGFVAIITNHFSVNYIFLLWSIFSIIAYFIYRRIERNDQPILSEGFEEDTKVPIKTQLRTILSIFKSSRFTLLIGLVSFSTLSLTSICEFITMGIFAEGKSKEELAGLFGILTIVANTLNLVINLFVFGKLISFFGVRSVTLIQPLVYLTIFAYYSFHDTMVAAFFGYMAYQTILVSIDNNNYNFLFNALPATGKQSLRTLIEGLCEPLATAAAGFFLLFYATDLPIQTVAQIALFISIIMLVLVLLLRTQYVPALVANLRSYWLDVSLPITQIIEDLPPSEVRQLTEQSRRKDSKVCLTAIRFLWIRDQKQALDLFLEYLPQAPERDKDAANNLLQTILKEDQPEILSQISLWLESPDSLRIRSDQLFQETFILNRLIPSEQFAFWQKSDQIDVSPETIALSRLHDWQLKENQVSLTYLETLLSGEKTQQLSAIRILGQSKQPSYAYSLVPFFKAEDATIRLAALQAFEQLACPDLTTLIPNIVERLKQNTAQEIPVILKIFERINDVAVVAFLIEHSTSFTPAEKRQIESLVVKIGKTTIPTIIRSLSDPSLNYSSRLASAKALASVSFSQFEMQFHTLVQKEITAGNQFANDYLWLQSVQVRSTGLNLLTRYYKEKVISVANFVLYLYNLIGLIPNGDLICASLHSENLKDKANAIETIEQSCGRKVSRQIFALIRKVEESTARPRHDSTISSEELTRRLIEILQAPDDLPAAFAAQALWELKSPELADLLKTILPLAKKTATTQTLRSIFKRRILQSEEYDNPNFVEKFHTIAHSELFGELSLTEIEYLVNKLEMRSCKPGATIIKANEPCEAVYCLYEGSVEVTYLDREKRIKETRGQTLAHEGYLAHSNNTTTIHANAVGCRLLGFRKSTLDRAVDTYPNVGIQLLTLKVRYAR